MHVVTKPLVREISACGRLVRGYARAGVLAAAVFVPAAWADKPAVPPGHNKPTIDQRPVVIPREDSKTTGKPDQKGRPDRAQPPGAEVKELVKQFQDAREAYLAQQKTLMDQMKGASESAREAIRELMRDNLDRWREQQKELMREQMDRAKEMKKELQTELGTVVDEASKGGRGR